MDELLTVAQVAGKLGVGETTLREWIDRTGIPFWQPGGPGGKIFLVWSMVVAHAKKHSITRGALDDAAEPETPRSPKTVISIQR